MTELVRFNLVFPPVLEDAITECLIAAPGMPGFTLLHAEGHTSDFSSAQVPEQVRGRVQRRVLWMVLPSARVGELLMALRKDVASGDARWWTEPVLGMGRLA
ncbi:TPA: DUF3240 family protein [Stenotrophomonas maltophilia]|uniref:DUF3240 family protein n=1 Tax=Stenotrophomonas sp. CC22-02 TaxID=1378087 RepID=UPI001062C651|nr:DUF3240 family protein [Stenotrophomonas sp. CC22-02]MBN5170606.1 DUF3240 family protein [Stenotrophomonas maltophilia]TDV30860.1 uncharacterized protein DUF3240 [Stenotrophomonas sp. CC22-02]HEL3778027.1 DUF3240 family protein [Stenotrophomonas maltophilia]HEL5005713.1 DUF3240 family protein [Stenotrophomonas maltophilia]